jgi:hypothetical protein
MTSFLTLALAAVFFTVLAFAAAWLHGATRRDMGLDLLLALAASLSSLVVAGFLFNASIPLDSSPRWRVLGSLALLASPLVSSLALRLRGRRSVPRALATSGIAVLLIVVWLTLQLEGRRGDWSANRVVSTALTAALIIASAACLGWWTKREPA